MLDLNFNEGRISSINIIREQWTEYIGDNLIVGLLIAAKTSDWPSSDDGDDGNDDNDDGNDDGDYDDRGF